MPLFPEFERLYPKPSTLSPPESGGGGRLPAPPESGGGGRESTAWVILQGGAILVEGDSTAQLPVGVEPPADFARFGPAIPLGTNGGRGYVLLEIPDDVVLDEVLRGADLRSLYGRLPEMEWSIAGYATQVAHWHRTSRFCPICGSKMGDMGQEWRRSCTACGHERYPIVSPAVLALVHDGDRVLLAHKPGWGARRSILAGFVLPGESLEECVRREVLEESGVGVNEIEYFGSQPWPFPQQLMIGFRTRYNCGTIRIDDEELAGADWYHFREMPPLPPPLSLSRQMIDAWVADRNVAADLK